MNQDLESYLQPIVSSLNLESKKGFSEERLFDVRNKVNHLVVQLGISSTSNQFRSTLMQFLRSTSTCENILALILLKFYLSKPKYKLQIPFLSDVLTNFLKPVTKIRDQVLSNFAAKIYDNLLQIAPKGIITKFEKNAKTLIQELTMNTVKHFEERVTMYKLLERLI